MAGRRDPEWFTPRVPPRTELLEGQAEFIEWLCTPPPDRDPRSQNELARRLGKDPGTLTRWKDDPLVREQWERRLRQMNVSPEAMQPIIQTLHAKAVGGDIKAAELYMKYVAQISPPKKVEIDDKRGIEELSDDEIADLAENVVHLRGA